MMANILKVRNRRYICCGLTNLRTRPTMSSEESRWWIAARRWPEVSARVRTVRSSDKCSWNCREWVGSCLLARDRDSRSQRGLTNARIPTLLRILRLPRVHRLSSLQQRVRLPLSALLPVRQAQVQGHLRRAWAAVGLRVRQASAAPARRCRRRVEAQAPRGPRRFSPPPLAPAHPLRMRRGPPPVVSPLASHRRPRLCRSSLPTPRWLRSLLLPRRLPLRRQSPTRLRHRPALPPAHLSGTPLLRHPRSALPQAPALRLLRPCHSDRRPHLHPQHLLRLPARRPRRPHRSDPASPPPPRPVQQALWERLRQYRFRPHAPSATQLPPPRRPVHCAGSPPAAVIRCSWPVASVPPSTPSPTWTSASSG